MDASDAEIFEETVGSLSGAEVCKSIGSLLDDAGASGGAEMLQFHRFTV